jgi:hypothetical protein
METAGDKHSPSCQKRTHSPEREIDQDRVGLALEAALDHRHADRDQHHRPQQAVICRIKNTVCQIMCDTARRFQQMTSALIIWRDIIFFLCVSKSLVFLALFFGPMPLSVVEVPD